MNQEGLRLWLRQVVALVRYELRRRLFRVGNLPLVVLAALPIVVVALGRMVSGSVDAPYDAVHATGVYALLYQVFMLRVVVFFGSVWIFIHLFRQEILEKTLHYLFLAPLRREVLVAGKFAAGLLFAGLLFGGSTLASYGVTMAGVDLDGMGPGAGVSILADGLQYLGVTLLGCLGYGAIFMAFGVVVKNPVFPAVVLFGWEFLEFLLPPFLKKLSVAHYLKGLSPVPTGGGGELQAILEVLAVPTPWYVAVPGFFVFVGLVLIGCGFVVRHYEIDYGES